jgi:hypothetical protein
LWLCNCGWYISSNICCLYAVLLCTKNHCELDFGCREETTPNTTIYDQEVNKLRNPEWNEDAHKVVEQLPTFESSRGSFYNERVKIIPILPATRSDIILEGQWTLTAANQRFLIADDGNDERILIFSTQQNLTHFTAADIIYGDGTFYTCPVVDL